MWNIFSGEPICVSQNIFSNQSFILTLTESWGEALGCKVDLGPALCWSWESRVWRAVFWRTWLDTIQHILEGFGFRGKEFVVWVLVRRICFLSFFLFLCLLVEKEKHLSRWMSSRLGEPVRFGNWFITRGLPKSLKNENRGLPKSLKIHVAHTPDHQPHKILTRTLTATSSKQAVGQKHLDGTRGLGFPSAQSAEASWTLKLLESSFLSF